jgi:hypothetical protein
VHIRKIGSLAADTQYPAFATARQELLTALCHWLGTGAAAPSAQDEVAATVSAIRQIATLNGVSS